MCNRRHGVDFDAVLGAFDLEHVHQADQAHLGGAVVGLAKVTHDPGATRREEDTAVSLFLHVDERWPGDVEGAAEVYIENGMEQVWFHIDEALVTQDACVVDHDVEAPVGVERLLDNCCATVWIRHRGMLSNRDPAGNLDLSDNRVGRRVA